MMNLRTFNVLMWFNRPAVQAAIIGLALLLATPFVSALQLINMHIDSCIFCQKFQSEVGDSGYNANDISNTVPMVTIDMDKSYPEWFADASREGRIQEIIYTPTFLLLDDDDREVGRVIGYKNPEWFFEKITTIVDAYEASQQ